MIKNTLRLLSKSILFLIFISVIYLNFGLYYQPHFTKTATGSINRSVFRQLQFLKPEIHSGTADRLQNQFPEGFVFFHALYGLTWLNIIKDLDKSSNIFRNGIKEVDYSITAINSSKGRETFTKDLPLTYGAFYNSWLNYLLGKRLSVYREDSSASGTGYTKLFKQNCSKIAQAIDQSPTPFLESYQESTWPADITVGIASLQLHDELYQPVYDDLIAKWLTGVKKKLDPATGLIPHYVRHETGETIDGARGSSQSLMLCFLKDIDEEFANTQFTIYKKLFMERRFGLPGIREYPKGTKGTGDIDSGPVWLDIGVVATIVGQNTMGVYEDWKNYEALRNSIETFGLGMMKKTKKKYIFGQFPMADAFIAWSNSIENNEKQIIINGNWRWRFQLLSLVIIIFAGWLLWKIMRF